MNFSSIIQQANATLEEIASTITEQTNQHYELSETASKTDKSVQQLLQLYKD
jgi:methyl-accepting chemotaxis protein